LGDFHRADAPGSFSASVKRAEQEGWLDDEVGETPDTVRLSMKT